MIYGDVLRSFQIALQRWAPLLAAHVFIRLVITSVLFPLIGLLLAATLVFSNQSALTDQDIAKFFLTPAGAIGAIVILSMSLVAIVLDVVVATAVLRQDVRRPFSALALATVFTAHSIPRLLPFVTRFLFRLLLIVLPFCAVGGVVWVSLLSAYDINYYLAERPREFVVAASIIAALGTAVVLVLLIKLTDWAIALHLALFDQVTSSDAFGESRRHMENRRVSYVWRLMCWGLLRMIAALVVGALAGALVSWIVGRSSAALEELVFPIVISLLVYSVVNASINAISNGALASLLNLEFDNALAGRSPALALDGIQMGAEGPRGPLLWVAAIALLSVLGLGTGGIWVNRLQQDAVIEVIAHRGAAAWAPENTLASVQRAIEDGADWIEIDVQETADGEVIVAHDSDFMKAANVPTKVWDVTTADLAEIDVGSWFDPAFSKERVPFLREVLETARDHANVLIELKYYGHDKDLENRVMAIVEDLGMTEQIATMSLKYPAVQKMLAIRPDLRSGILAATSVGNLSGLEGDFLAMNLTSINASMIVRAEDAGKDVYAWTVNDPASIVRMIWIGIDGVITDDPALARKVITAYNDLSVVERLLLALSDRLSVAFEPENINSLRP